MLEHIPYGRALVTPFVWAGTLAHELGHGMTALALGGEFHDMQVFVDGSGVARTAVSGGLAQAAVAAGGLLCPALIAAVCFVMARFPQGARATLAAGSLTAAAAALVWLTNLFGIVFALALALALAALVKLADASVCRVACALLGTQLALSVMRGSGYLFASVAVTDAGTMMSDTAQIASALGLPGALCGLSIGLLSLCILVEGVWWGLRPLDPTD